MESSLAMQLFTGVWAVLREPKGDSKEPRAQYQGETIIIYLLRGAWGGKGVTETQLEWSSNMKWIHT